jgi:hypothetical protein
MISYQSLQKERKAGIEKEVMFCEGKIASDV